MSLALCSGPAGEYCTAGAGGGEGVVVGGSDNTTEMSGLDFFYWMFLVNGVVSKAKISH